MRHTLFLQIQVHGISLAATAGVIHVITIVFHRQLPNMQQSTWVQTGLPQSGLHCGTGNQISGVCGKYTPILVVVQLFGNHVHAGPRVRNQLRAGCIGMKVTGTPLTIWKS